MQENKMGVMPVKKLIINMSLPMMASMLVQALYNVVDSMFVSRFDAQYALTAVTLAFPMQNFMFAFAGGLGVGVNALLSKSLGEQKQERADAAANNGILLTFFSYLAFLALGLVFAKTFIESQTEVEQVRAYGTAYLRICMTMSAGMFYQVLLERLLQSTGRTVLSMYSQMTGAIINCIFDPIMIFGLLGFPRLGVAGAAYATVLGQSVAAVLGLYLNIRKNREINISIAGILKPAAWAVRRIFYVGIPSVAMIAIGSLMTYAMNMILKPFGADAQAVFGAYFKLQSFVFMPVFGLNNGVIPILAFNYGARRRDRIEESLRFSLTLAVIIMSVGTLIFLLVPGLLLKIFNASEALLSMGIPALRIICLCFPLAGANIALGSTFQAFSKSTYSLAVSIGRQLVILIPVAYLLSLTAVVRNIWWSFLLAELMSFVLTIHFFRKLYRDVVLRL